MICVKSTMNRLQHPLFNSYIQIDCLDIIRNLSYQITYLYTNETFKFHCYHLKKIFQMIQGNNNIDIGFNDMYIEEQQLYYSAVNDQRMPVDQENQFTQQAPKIDTNNIQVDKQTGINTLETESVKWGYEIIFIFLVYLWQEQLEYPIDDQELIPLI
ncbi:hypothetical protein pb186bvf_014235 [Paramecium bursaria]